MTILPAFKAHSAIVCTVVALTVVLEAHSQKLAFLGTHTLAARWELADSLKNGTFLITPYKPVFMLPAVWSSAPDRSPTREGETTPPSIIPLTDVELKFQWSFKSKVAQGLFKGHGDLWVAYTQSSRWQVYNQDLSRPFRETNYEPEVMFVLPIRYRLLGLNGKMMSVGLNHQSNGRAEPLSRSWNRLMAQVGLERGRCTLLVRPWWRIIEDPDVDENPDITQLLGSGELILIYQHRSHVISLQARHSFDLDPFVGGSIQGDWSFTLDGNLKAHFQVFHGHGESLIDYNHEQTTIGLGISLLEWL